MHRPAFLLALVAVLSVSCLADVADAPEPAEGELGVFPGGGGGPAHPDRDPFTAARYWHATHHSACSEACWGVAVGRCDPCMEGDEDIECAGMTLTCLAAERALSQGVAGLEWCWKSCGGLLGH